MKTPTSKEPYPMWRRRLGLVLALAAALLAAGCEPNNQGYAPDQPIKYSHALHAGALQIPCQYCHFSAERGRHAGIPPAQVCMNCHTQVKPDLPEVMKIKQAIDGGQPIPWVRVHKVPDHVYFDHSVHVSKGVACQDCHGQCQEMDVMQQWAPVNMGWCIDCHRTSPLLVEPARGGPLTECAVCHH